VRYNQNLQCLDVGRDWLRGFRLLIAGVVSTHAKMAIMVGDEHIVISTQPSIDLSTMHDVDWDVKCFLHFRILD